MAKSAPPSAPAASVERVVMTVDIGGSHVKILLSSGGTKRAADSGPDLTPELMVASVKELAKDLHYDLIAIGYPGPVLHNKPAVEPVNLGKGWVGFDFSTAFGVPVKLVNDALMQAIGSYDGGRMLFLGLGTGLGAAMIADNVALPMELAHLPYKKGLTYEQYVGADGLKRRGKKKWRKSLFDVVARLRAALEPDYVVLGGGNVELLDALPEGCKRGGNEFAFEGGFRLWRNEELRF